MHGCAKPQKLDKKVLTKGKGRGIITRLSEKGGGTTERKREKSEKLSENLLTKERGCGILSEHLCKGGREGKSFLKNFWKTP